jgi:hypothetical protein
LDVKGQIQGDIVILLAMTHFITSSAGLELHKAGGKFISSKVEPVIAVRDIEA